MSSSLMRPLLILMALLCANCLCLLSAAHAIPRENASELQVAASLVSPAGSGSSNVNADLAYGFFLNPYIQVGLRLGYTLNQRDDEADVWNAATAPFVNVHFPRLFADRRFVPYLGGFLGAVWNDRDGTGAIGPEGGLKFYLTDDAFVAARYRYEWFFNELQDPDTTDANHIGLIALGYQWGGTESTMLRYE